MEKKNRKQNTAVLVILLSLHFNTVYSLDQVPQKVIPAVNLVTSNQIKNDFFLTNALPLVSGLQSIETFVRLLNSLHFKLF